MNKQKNILSICIVSIALILIVVLCVSLYKNYKYNQSILEQNPVNGTYAIKNGKNEINETYIAIDSNDQKVYYYSNMDPFIKSTGSVAKDKGGSYILTSAKTNKVFAKVIPSYNKIYFIDVDLNVLELEKIDSVIIEKE